jgi:hypothetical protein
MSGRNQMKHGALWLATEEDFGAELVLERYDAALDVIGAVFRKRGLFLAVVYEKNQDPGLSVPHWSQRDPDSWFDTADDATRHLSGLLGSTKP